MKRGIVTILMAGAGALAVGCGSDSTPAVSQLDYNLTVEADRAMWKPEGLSYQGSVGPYAVFTVTAAEQKLVGPRVLLPSKAGVAILATAQNYFVTAGTGGNAQLSLECAGKQVVSSPQGPTKDGNCTMPSQSTGDAPTAGSDGNTPPPNEAADLGGWGSGCTSGSGGSSGGSSGGGGYGGSGGGGYGGSSGGSGGSYGNPGGYGGGGWNNGGCDGGSTSGGSPDGGSNGGTPPGGNPPGGSNPPGTNPPGSGSGGGSGSSGGGGAGTPSGGSDSNGGADVAVVFQRPAPVGSTVLLRSITIHTTQTTRSADSAPGICCTNGQCALSGSGHIQ